jgi:PcrA/UvrD tudor domain
MQANAVNGWREVLARVFAGFDAEYGLMPEWLVNPGTNRRLKLDYFFRDIAVAVRFVGLEGGGRRRPKTDDEVASETQREQARAAVCKEHGVVLVSIDPDGEPRTGLRDLEMGLARASAQLAQSSIPHERKQALMPRLSEARRRAGEFTLRLKDPRVLNLYAEMWRDRQADLVAQAPSRMPPPRPRSYRVGMAVEHERFGPGQVIGVQPEDGDVKVTVDFVEAGVRSFYASLLDGTKLRVLHKNESLLNPRTEADA